MASGCIEDEWIDPTSVPGLTGYLAFLDQRPCVSLAGLVWKLDIDHPRLTQLAKDYNAIACVYSVDVRGDVILVFADFASAELFLNDPSWDRQLTTEVRTRPNRTASIAEWGRTDSLIRSGKLPRTHLKWYSPLLDPRDQRYDPWQWMSEALDADLFVEWLRM